MNDRRVERSEAERWQHLKALLEEGLRLSSADRVAFVAQATKDDEALGRELASLLDAAAPTAAIGGASLVHDFLADLAQRVEPWIGSRVGAYRVTRLIAHGGMGEVYEGHRDDGQYEQRVAIKVVREGPDRAFLLERFDSERRILATLEHPNLARLIDAGVSDWGDPFFVMELVIGWPIDVYCAQNAVSIRERIVLMRAVCQVVHYAHNQGVIHRDIKPQNILVTAAGTVKLVDFGIAKRFSSNGVDPPTVVERSALTPEYASPEQLHGEVLGPASDIYSLGVVLYRLLTGTSPYAPALANKLALAQAICQVEPTRPSAAAPISGNGAGRRSLRGDLDAVVMMALRKEPSLRFSTAEEMADDLFRHLEGLPVRARRGATSYKISRWIVRHRTVVLAIGVANIALVIGVALASWQAIEANNQRGRAARNAADLRDLANVLMFDVHDRLVNVAGTTDARKLIVQNAVAYLEKVSAQAQSNPQLQLDIAVGYRKVGDALGRAFFPNLGDSDGALAQYKNGVKAAEALQADRNLGIKASRELALLYGRMAGVKFSRSEFEQARAYSLKAIDVAKAAMGEDAEGKKLLAIAYVQYAKSLTSDADLAPVLELTSKALELFAAAVGDKPDTELELSVAATKSLKAWVYERTGQLSAALELNASSREIPERVLLREPDNLRARLMRAVAARDQASVLLRLKRPSEALPLATQSVETWRVQMKKDTRDVAALHHLINAVSVLGASLRQSGLLGEAISAMQEVTSIYESLPKDQQQRPLLSEDYQAVLYALAGCYEERGAEQRGQAGRADLSKALELLETTSRLRAKSATKWQEKDGDLATEEIDTSLQRVSARLRGMGQSRPPSAGRSGRPPASL
ncbi:serine/threonine-protein kinase [Roseateles sp. NT4]|uniref:serine/threonine-protein kinase n=1 Tax=Roseateles sp. NT4 TaxID=3453715 RepID=UPI003EEAF3D4